jgi:hypothetical protein
LSGTEIYRKIPLFIVKFGCGMAGKMNVNLFQVSRSANALPLPDLLQGVSQLPLEERIRRISYGEMRLDHVEPPNSENNASPYWLLDFVKMRFDHGPGRVGKNTAIAGFDLGADEGFGEETAALYDADTGYMVVQYNHHGVRASAIESYFNILDHDPGAVGGYEMVIKLDTTSEIRLAQKNLITKLHFKIAPGKMTAAHRAANVSLDQVLRLNSEQHGNTIEVTISAAPRENLITQRVFATIDALKRMVAADQEEGTRVVSQFDVNGKVDVLDKADAINMIAPKLELTIDGLMLGDDKRYTRRSRWDGLLRARRGWQDIIG